MVEHNIDSKHSPHNIFRKFRQGVFYEDLYKEFNITEGDLIAILERKIKGNYDYKRILKGGAIAHKQFIAHLDSRWNPLKQDTHEIEIHPYLPEKNPI